MRRHRHRPRPRCSSPAPARQDDQLVERVVGPVRRVAIDSSPSPSPSRRKAADELRQRIRLALRSARLPEGQTPKIRRPGTVRDRPRRPPDQAALWNLYVSAERILTAFPVEAGLPRGVTVLDEHRLDLDFDQLVRGLLRRSAEPAGPGADGDLGAGAGRHSGSPLRWWPSGSTTTGIASDRRVCSLPSRRDQMSVPCSPWAGTCWPRARRRAPGRPAGRVSAGVAARLARTGGSGRRARGRRAGPARRPPADRPSPMGNARRDCRLGGDGLRQPEDGAATLARGLASAPPMAGRARAVLDAVVNPILAVSGRDQPVHPGPGGPPEPAGPADVPRSAGALPALAAEPRGRRSGADRAGAALPRPPPRRVPGHRSPAARHRDGHRHPAGRVLTVPRPAVLRRRPEAIAVPLPPSRHRPLPPDARDGGRGRAVAHVQLPVHTRPHRLDQPRVRRSDPPRRDHRRHVGPAPLRAAGRLPGTGADRCARHPARRRAPPEGHSSRELREAEAAGAAAIVTRIRSEGWLFATPTEPPPRPAWADIAVLIPARTALGQLEGALRRAGIPYRLDTGSLVYAADEIRALLLALRAIDYPSTAWRWSACCAARSSAAATRTSTAGATSADGARNRQAPRPPRLAGEDPVWDALADLDERIAARSRQYSRASSWTRSFAIAV